LIKSLEYETVNPDPEARPLISGVAGTAETTGTGATRTPTEAGNTTENAVEPKAD